MTVPDAPQGPVSQAALGALWLYKRTLSPAFYFLGARCRHQPTCSDYAVDAFRRHGAWRGFWLSFSRVSRCHPFGSHGFDPVPETLPDAGWRFWRYGDWRWTERGADGSRTH
jgi:putative membrane protein insertion efficiency factor